jgi:hypothetical protein
VYRRVSSFGDVPVDINRDTRRYKKIQEDTRPLHHPADRYKQVLF